jgi:hypothetical protein
MNIIANMNIKNLFIIFLIQHTGFVSAGQPDIDYEEIKKHLLETYTRPHVHQYKGYDYVVTSNNFLTDEKFMTLTRQAYKNDPKAQKTLSELRDEYQKRLYLAHKEADKNLQVLLLDLDPSTMQRVLHAVSGVVAVIGIGLACLCEPIPATVLGLAGSSAAIFILLPKNIDKDLIHRVDAQIATRRLDGFIKDIEKIQKKCLTKNKKLLKKW